jgi:uncharacterized membrane protein YgdD (TMEM256/DUF423 family)
MNRMQAVSALNVGLAVGIGAFGAHALKGRITDDLLTVFHTGPNYHLAMALAALLFSMVARPLLQKATVALFVGTLLFSGSLYALALTGIRMWGAVTPLGGVTWIGTWVAVAVHLWNNPIALGTPPRDLG